METKQLSWLHFALLAAMLIIGSTAVQANMTIKVKKSGEAPYLYADNNNLFQIDMGNVNHNSLEAIRFENNHINGIDLSKCPALVADSIMDVGNGRTITANVVQFQARDDETGELLTKYLYYFQLNASTEDKGGGHYLNNEVCAEDNQSDNDTRTYGRNATQGTTGKTLNEDHVDLSRITWSQRISGTRNRARADYGTLDPTTIIGDIVVLDNEAGVYSTEGHGTETYSYNNGVSNSEFYLEWTADGNIDTEVVDLTGNSLSVAGGQGCITVNAPQAMSLTVIDLAGHVVMQRDIDAGPTVLDAIQPGIYIVAGQKIVVR